MKATRVCSVESCERPHYGRGMCELHWRRFRDHGSTDRPIPVRLTAAERLATKLIRMPNGCLEWTGSLNVGGYGLVGAGGKVFMAHRLAWILVNGPISDGMCICHTCDNRPCCNVEHLWLGTKADNNADRDAKGRHVSWEAKKTQCPQGHPYDEANTYTSPSRPTKRHCRECNRIRGRITPKVKSEE